MEATLDLTEALPGDEVSISAVIDVDDGQVGRVVNGFSPTVARATFIVAAP